MRRCFWCSENPLYIEYHDKEWGLPERNDGKLFELLLLEPFQAGLSWETILNKRESFRKAFDNFDPEKIQNYGEEKISELLSDKSIIRNRRKIEAAVNNAKIFLEIKSEFGSFSNYIWRFTNNTTVYETGRTRSELSDKISSDLKNRGMKFIGTTIIYAYLQAIGVIYSHDKNCFLYKNK